MLHLDYSLLRVYILITGVFEAMVIVRVAHGPIKLVNRVITEHAHGVCLEACGRRTDGVGTN